MRGTLRATRRASKGQLFSFDLIISLAIFLVVLLSASYMLSHMRENADSANEKDILAGSAGAAFDTLAYSPGYPLDWTNETVSSVGLATIDGWTQAQGSARRIDAAKLLQYAKMDYFTAKALLGLGAFETKMSFHEAWNASNQSAALAESPARSGIALEPIAYYAESDRDAFDLLNGKNVSWDYYWAGSGAAPEQGDSREFYSAGQYGGKAELFNALLDNASRLAYRTIIVEQPNFTTGDYGAVNQTLLRDFFKARGLLVFEGSVSAYDSASTPLLLDDLNASLVFSDVQQTGFVNQTGFFLDNVTAGAAEGNASFDQSAWAVYSNASRGDSALSVFVQNASDSALGLVARWDCDNGRVYYVADFNSFFGANSTPGSSVYNLVGSSLDFGIEPDSSANDIFVIQNQVIL